MAKCYVVYMTHDDCCIKPLMLGVYQNRIAAVEGLRHYIYNEIEQSNLGDTFYYLAVSKEKAEFENILQAFLQSAQNHKNWGFNFFGHYNIEEVNFH